MKSGHLRLFWWITLLVLPGGLGCNYCTYAQSIAENKAYRHVNMMAVQIGVRQGLSQGLVTDMAQDSEGYLWVGTPDGLNRCDGTHIKVFRHDPDDSFSIRDNKIQKIFIDCYDNVWVSMETGEFDLFDRATESFIHLPAWKTPNRADNEGVKGIISDGGDGSVILQTGPDTKIVRVIQKDAGRPPTFEVKDILSAYPALKNIFSRSPVWRLIDCDNKGSVIYSASDSVFVFTSDVLVKGGMPVSTKGLYIHQSSSENSKSGIYIDSAKKVIKKFDYTLNKFITVYRAPAYMQCADIKFDGSGRMWIKIVGGNCLRIDLRTGITDSIDIDWENVDPVARRNSAWLRTGKDGNMFLGTGGYGMMRLLARTEVFRHFPAAYGGPMVRTIVPGDAKLFDERKLRTYLKARDTDRLPLFKNIKLASSIYDRDALFCASFWVFDTGFHFALVKANFKNGAVTIQAKVDRSICTRLLMDKRGDIWFFAKMRSGVANFCHIISPGKTEEFQFPGLVKEDGYSFICDWLQLPGGTFWLATRHGIYSFDPMSKTFQHFENNKEDKTSLSYNIVLAVCLDPLEPQRYLWAGTAGRGLDKLDITTGSCIHYTVAEGLPNNVIYSIMPDRHKNLWLSTNYGICQFNPKTGETRNFTTNDGLPYNEFNTYESAHDTNGCIYFGSMNGWVGFDPEYFYKPVPSSKVVISRLELQNTEVEYKHSTTNKFKENTLPAPIEKCTEITLGPDIRVFTLGFSVVDLGNFGKNHFRYILEGFNKDWVDAGTRDEATFTNIPQGTYIFKVLGCNSNNVWSTVPAALRIIINPPWWATWWFRLSVVCGVVLVFYGLYSYRVNQLLKVERLRNTIALNLHDEIGSSLSSISLYAAVLKRKANGLSEESDRLVEKLISNTSEIMENMNDIVWATKEDMSSFETVISRMRNFAVDMTEIAGINLVFDATSKADQLTLSMQQRKNVYMFFKEAINNAIKHSGANLITVAISVNGKILEIIINDNGNGFKYQPDAPNGKATGGNGLESMKFRAEQIRARLTIDTLPGNGTTLTLRVPVK